MRISSKALIKFVQEPNYLCKVNMWKIIGSCLLIVGLLACENDPSELAAFSRQLTIDQELVEEVEIVYSDSAQIKVTIYGPTMINYLERADLRQEFPDGVLVHFFGPLGDTSSTLEALYGLRRERQGEVIVRDSVVWESASGEKLETNELIWDERRREIYTKKFVVLTRPEEIIYGHGFTADQDFSNARINSVEGRIAVDQPGATAPSDSLNSRPFTGNSSTEY